MRRLYLASGSPRRAELLDQVAVPFTALRPPGIDETPAGTETAEAYVQRMAAEKARAGAEQLGHNERQAAAVLGADTSVVLADRILGKPASAAEATDMLALLSGREHRVLSAVSLLWDARQETRLSVSTVAFAPLSPALIARYVASGEPMDKAGAYGIQGRGAFLIERMDGSYSGVVGLPLRETFALLEQAGILCWATGN